MTTVAEEDEAAESSPTEMQIAVTLVECSGCGQEREAERDCACGELGEEDPLVAERQEALAPTVARLNEGVRAGSSSRPVDPTEWWDVLGAWLEELLNVIAGACADDRFDATEIDQQVQRLRDIEDEVAATPIRRPYVAARRALDGMLQHLREAAQHYLMALTTGTQDAVKSAGADAQEAIDAAHAQLRRFREIERRTELVEESAGEGVLGSLTGMVRAGMSSGIDLTDTDSLRTMGSELFARVTGRGDPPDGAGFGLVVSALQVEMIADERRYWQVVTDTCQRLLAHPERLTNLAADPAWQESFKAASAELAETGFELAPMLSSGRQSSIVRSVIRLGAVLTERVAPPLLATVLTVAKGREYSRVRRYDPMTLVKHVSDQRWNLSLGLDAAIRDADAHRAYAVEGDGVRFFSDRREYDHLDWDEFPDRVLAGWETVLAAFTAIFSAMAALDLDVDVLDPVGAVDVEPTEVIVFMAAFAGLTDVAAHVDNSELVVAASGPELPSLTHIGVILRDEAIPDGVDTARFEIHTPDGQHTLSGPVGPFREFRMAADEDQRFAIAAQLQLWWQRDGVAFLSARQARIAAAGEAGRAFSEAADGDLRSAVGRIRPWLYFAKKTGDDELTEAMTGMLSAVRERAMQLPVSVASRRACRTLLLWAENPAA